MSSAEGLSSESSLAPSEPARFRRERDVDADDVGLPEQVFLGRRIAEAGLVGALLRDVLAPDRDLHAEGLADLAHAGAELAEPDDAEVHPLDVRAERGLPWRAGLELVVLVADVARQFENEPPGDAGGRIAEAAGAADRDALRLRGLHVDAAIDHARGDQELEIRQLVDDVFRERRALSHRADDGKSLQRLDDVVVAAEVLVEHLDVDVVCDFRPVGARERDVLVVVENCAAMLCHLTILVIVRLFRRLQQTDRLAVEVRADVLDYAAIAAAEILLRHIAEMRRQHHVVELAQRMLNRQRLHVVDVEAGACDPLVAERVEHGSLVDQRTRGWC